MARKIRRWAPGAITHVDARGHDGMPIFASEDDRAFVVERAARVFAEEGAVCLAWAILLNHFHMLVRFLNHPKRPMQRLNTAIAKRWRRRMGGRGAVFQDRYFGDPCDDHASVMTRFAYVTANPIHHRIVRSVEELELHPWSSLGELTGRRRAKLVDPRAALALLDAPQGRELECLRRLLEDRVRYWNERDAGSIVAPDAEMDELLEMDQVSPSPGPSVRIHPDALVKVVSATFDVSADAMRTGHRGGAFSSARAVVAYLACARLSLSPTEVAPLLGVSESAVVHARRNGPSLLAAAGVDEDDVLRRCTE